MKKDKLSDLRWVKMISKIIFYLLIAVSLSPTLLYKSHQKVSQFVNLYTIGAVTSGLIPNRLVIFAVVAKVTY